MIERRSAFVQDTLNPEYVQDISPYPLLSFKEEQHLARCMIKGRTADPQNHQKFEFTPEAKAAHDLLINSNQRLVISIAEKYRGHGVSFNDLEQEGNLGLIRAIDKFDPERGYKLSTYATWWIRQAVARAISGQGQTIQLPVYLLDKIIKMNRVSNISEQKTGQKPTDDQLAQQLETTVETIRRWKKASQKTESLDTPIGESDDDRTLGDFIPSDEPNPADTVQGLNPEKIAAVLATLAPREEKILRLRYGFTPEGGRSLTLEEVGKKFGLTRERIRQIEAKALKKLRHPRRARKLRNLP